MNIPLFKILWDDDDIAEVTDVIKRGTYWTTGPTVEKFENQISDYFDRKYCLSFNSGTSALHSLLIAYNIKRGDEVIVPSFTFISTANAPVFTGAKPVFADIEQKTFGLDPDSVIENISKKTKAIIPVHFGGCPCQIKELTDIAEDYNIVLLEDVAESFGGMKDNQKLGTFGDSSMLSFCQNKIITTGEGGAIITDSAEIFERLKLIRSHGREEASNYFTSTDNFDYVQLGYNFRMSDITAAVGIAQLQKVDKIIEMRRANAQYLSNLLSEVEMVNVPHFGPEYFNVYQMFTIWIEGGREVRDALKKCLADHNIIAKIYFSPVHLTKYYRESFGFNEGDLPITELVSNHVLTLPFYPSMTTEEMDYITDVIKLFFENYPSPN